VWISRFAHDPNIVGRNFLLNDKPVTLVGIMPKRFAFWGGDSRCPRPSIAQNRGPIEALSSCRAISGRN
jgi:hypothetical protein